MEIFKKPSTNEPVVHTVASKQVQLPSSTSDVSCTEKPSPEIILPDVNIPSWCGIPQVEYGLEVLKQGTIIEKLSLAGRSAVVFGRIDGNDVRLDHPSISRRHAVLAYCVKSQDSNKAGWYVKDLGSTHGCLVNKIALKPFQWQKVMVGHVLKFGLSSRLYVMQGPADDMEEELDLSSTQLKKESVIAKQTVLDPDKCASGNEKDGISWGISEESNSSGDEEEQSQDLGEPEPFATVQEREQYYLNDPEKALKCFFDREGLEMEFEFLEKGSTRTHQWCCQAELPIESKDGRPVVAEVTVGGSKREAQVQCALEACRILDACGVLRQNNNLRKRKKHNWEENDFYDSDEDEFLDRTGDLGRKREKRRQLVALEKAGSANKAREAGDTYDGLLTKLDCVYSEMNSVKSDLESLSSVREKSRDASQYVDLDDYMSQLTSSKVCGSTIDLKVKKSKLKTRLTALQQEESRLKRLAEVAKPSAKLPELNTITAVTATGGKFVLKNSVLIGSIKRKEGVVAPKLKVISSQRPDIINGSKPIQSNDSADYAAIDKTIAGCSGNSFSTSNTISPSRAGDDDLSPAQRNIEADKSKDRIPVDTNGVNDSLSIPTNIEASTDESCLGMLAPEQSAASIIENTGNESKQNTANIVLDTKIQEDVSTAKRKRIRTKPEKTLLDDSYASMGAEYATWIPPQGQSGDGRTSLNEKYGY